MPAGIPASAPAHIASFPVNMHIAQGHIRTRSVQGEPPSASLFSPTTPAGHQSWSMSQVEPQLRGDGGAPTYQVDNPSTWIRRGYTDLNTGVLIAPPPQRVTSTAASLPNNFAPPQYVSPTEPTGFPSSVGHPPLSALATVSPGVYQAGFAIPTYRPAYMPTPPRAVPSRSERRGSISSSPYSPRSKPLPGLSLGPIRNNQRRESDTIGGKDREVRSTPDESLPSAGVQGLHRGPFEGVLPVEGDLSMGQS
jgi:hypothetical protein